MTTGAGPALDWHKVAETGELSEGRVKTVTAARRNFALTHFEGKICALDIARKVDTVDQRGEIVQRWKIWREEKRRRQSGTRGRGLNSAAIFAALGEALDDDAIIAVDVGNNTYSFGRYFECTGQSVLMSGYLGSIGFSFPAAMGAWAATQGGDPLFKGRQVVSVSGDGGFGQYLAELTTAVKYDMNITHVLLNNSELGKISKEQRAGNWEVWQTSLHNPHFGSFARLCGAAGVRVNDAGRFGKHSTMTVRRSSKLSPTSS